jgi:DNA-binding XRE family transcriptional regulator
MLDALQHMGAEALVMSTASRVGAPGQFAVMVVSIVSTLDPSAAAIQRWSHCFPESTSLAAAPEAPAARVEIPAPRPDAAEQVRDVLRLLGLTKTQLAEVCGVSRQTLYDWMGDRFTPDGEHASRLHELHELSLLLPRHGFAPLRARLLTEAVTPDGSVLELLRRPELDLRRLREVVVTLGQRSAELDAHSARGTRERHGVTERDRAAEAQVLAQNVDDVQPG